MYGWLWRHFPGGLPGRVLCSLLLVAASVAVLFVFVFPRVEGLLPFQDVTVTGPGPTSPATPAG